MITTSTISYKGRSFQIDFDFIAHLLRIEATSGSSKTNHFAIPIGRKMLYKQCLGYEYFTVRLAERNEMGMYSL
jgi:hypothetical protein